MFNCKADLVFLAEMVKNLKVAANVRRDKPVIKETGTRNENEIGARTKDQGLPAVLSIDGMSNQSGDKVSN
jgi:hypothetical protein